MDAVQAPSFRPLYEQVKLLLTRSLMEGEWKPGDAIPSEIDLAGRFRVSQGTVRKAIDALAHDNILVRRQGKGTFVASHNEEHAQYRFLRIVDERGLPPLTHSTLLELRRGRAHAEAARALDLKPSAAVFTLKRTLDAGEQALILDEIVLPAALFKGLGKAQIKQHRSSWYCLYETNFGVRTIRAQERIRAVAASGEAARVLGVEPGSPLLCVERVAYTYDDQPVEWRRGLCCTDKYCYLNELT